MVMVHTPRYPSGETDEHVMASVMDLVAASDPELPSVLTALKAHGGKIYTPETRITEAVLFIVFDGSPLDGELKGGLIDAEISSNGSYFEQLLMPPSFLYENPGVLELCINDGKPRYLLDEFGNPKADEVLSICGDRRDTAGMVVERSVPKLASESGKVPVSPYISYD